MPIPSLRRPGRGEAAMILSLLKSPSQRRHTLRWLRSLYHGNSLRAGVPWLTFDAQTFLGAALPRSPRVFEYGSGGSTLYWLGLGARCVSVEHDANWHAQVAASVGRNPALDHRLVPPEEALPDASADSSDPAAYRSSDPAHRMHTFRTYASQIDTFPDGTFDIVLVDGRARPSCLLHASPKVRPGGLLVLDNADRPHYLALTAKILAPFETHRFHGAGPFLNCMWRTDVFVRRA